MYVIRCTDKDGTTLYVAEEDGQLCLAYTLNNEFAKRYLTELDAKVDRCYIGEKYKAVIEKLPE